MTVKGRLFVVSAPSGAGKTTLIRHVLEAHPELSYSVSSTTRQPRENEIDGKDYFFISPEAFKEKIQNGEWLEWAQVHDNYYGTSRTVVEACLAQGKSLLLDIDVQGAEQVMASDLEPVTIFIEPPSVDELEKRLRGRDTDSDDVIEKRLKNAASEMALKDRYRYQLVNDDLDQAVIDILAVFHRELA